MHQGGSAAALSHLPEKHSLGEAAKPKRQRRASKRISMRQASNIMEAVAFAKSIDLPLVAHLTIHWGRALINITQEELARAAHLHPNSIRYLERQERITTGFSR